MKTNNIKPDDAVGIKNTDDATVKRQNTAEGCPPDKTDNNTVQTAFCNEKMEKAAANKNDATGIADDEDKKTVLGVNTEEEQNDEQSNRVERSAFDDFANLSFPPLPLPDPVSDFRGCISAFGFSQQGESHLKKNMPCQDRSAIGFLSDSVVSVAVADGVGSCAMSEYGAATAVESSIEYLKKHLGSQLVDPSFVLDTKYMGRALREMMQYAYEQVEKKAAEIEQLLYSLQSTLTVAVYDGKTLYFAHAGDDGIVALTHDGRCELATTRHKGEEASSVFPLQSRNTWQFGKVDNVVGFILATDGVLDAFVRNESEGNRVYYPFIEPAFSSPLSAKEDVSLACNDWYAFMKTPKYRSAVTDDLSFICVANQEALAKAKKPSFDFEEWKRKTREFEEQRKAALYPHKNENKAEDKTRSKAKPIEKTTVQNEVQKDPSIQQYASERGKSQHDKGYEPKKNTSQKSMVESPLTENKSSASALKTIEHIVVKGAGFAGNTLEDFGTMVGTIFVAGGKWLKSAMDEYSITSKDPRNLSQNPLNTQTPGSGHKNTGNKNGKT